ncbi:MAG: N-acetyl-gamma-glutamyl-phosphate reductase [Pseudomonadota bacterium]
MTTADTTKVFIDGQAGTTGLQITERLGERRDLVITHLSEDERKDPQARQGGLQAADVAILCLPDIASKEAVALAQGETRIIDASTAFRTDPEWAYGLPELNANQREQIREATYVSNPGCYPQGVILFMRPLIDAGLVDANINLKVHAVSGYSGGGRQMIEAQQAWAPAQADTLNSQTYSLNLNHKHLPEMQLYSGLNHTPLFTPTVAHYYKGMLVHVPLFFDEVTGDKAAIVECLSSRYANERFVKVIDGDRADLGGYLNPTGCNDTNQLELFVFGSDSHYLLVARYDNLGKGAAGAAVQCLNIMIGADEATGL